jgi:hypothetical protein
VTVLTGVALLAAESSFDGNAGGNIVGRFVALGAQQ